MSVKAAENGLNKVENIINKDDADAAIKCFSVFLIKRLRFRDLFFQTLSCYTFFIY